jgi:starch synthase/alpha-amylase
MIGPIYGSLPVAHDTGGIHDTVVHMNVNGDKGNGFLFGVHDSNGLLWAIDQAVQFHLLPPDAKSAQIERIMKDSLKTFNHAVTARKYIDLYETMLQRPLMVRPMYS